MEDVIAKLKSDFKVVKNLIIQKIPYSAVVLNENKWSKISAAYATKTEKVIRQQKLQSYCIIDYIIGTAHKDATFSRSCESMIKVINDEISIALDFIESHPIHKGHINNIISNMLSSMDTDIQSNNSDFKNWVNELFVFNKLTRCSAYTLVDMERTLSNKKSVDYVFIHNETGKELLMDVVTFQNIDPTKHDTADTFNDFIKQRIQIKYNSKLDASAGVGMFRVLPVIEYQAGMEKFIIEVDTNISFPALTICRNKVEDAEEIILLEMNVYLEQIRKQKK